jgi:transcriptional regulator with XRE-family HTH domain
MSPQAIKGLREHLGLTQEVFARILGVSFATVNRWENGKTVPTGDYARVLQTLQQLSARDGQGLVVDWKRVGALSAMAAVAGFSPLLTLGAALAPVLIAQLPSWADVPLGEIATDRPRSRAKGRKLLATSGLPQNPVPWLRIKPGKKRRTGIVRGTGTTRAHTR